MSAAGKAPDAARRLDARALARWPLPAPAGDDDKEDRGHVVVVAGSLQVPGAALLAGVAALRAGAGKVVIATVEPAALPLALALPEAAVIGLPTTAAGGIAPDAAQVLRERARRASALLVGPGMQDEAAARDLTIELLSLFDGTPAVVDAAAMGAVVADKAASGAAARRAGVLITPHAGEMAHLTGAARFEIEADPQQAARAAAAAWGVVVALKGARTVIAAADDRPWLHGSNNPGLGTAGSGDVLAGAMAGLAARGATLMQAAAWGVVLHALAGARLARRVGRVGYLARELSAEFPGLLEELARTAP